MALKTSRQKLLEAIDQCRLAKLRSLVNQGHNIHMENTLGQNFLVHILQQQNSLYTKKRFQLFQFLITNYNLTIHSFDYYGKNLFNWAANLNCTPEALYLLNISPGDIDILVRDHTGSCSLHYGVEHGNEILVHAIVNYLLRYRLRFDIKDAHNNTPEDLAKKLGYDKISNFLGEACRSTVFFSREIPPPELRPMTEKSRSSSSMISSTLYETSEYFNFIEGRVSLAKTLDDWKTVSALRAFKDDGSKKIHPKKIPDPTPANHIHRVSTPSLPLILSNRRLSQPEQMLPLLELQMTSSFRRPFTPLYQQNTPSNASLPRSSNNQRKMSQTSSSRHLSSVMSHRKRDSDVSQISTSMIADLQSRLSVAPVHKQHRPSMVTTN